MDSSLNLYLSVSRLIFSSENLNYTEFESNFTKLYQSLTCFACGKLLIEAQSPNSPGNCKHYLCLDCLNKRLNVFSKSDCRLCSDYARNPQLQLVLKCFKELCEYIKISSVYSLIEKHFEEESECFGTLDDSQVRNLMQLIEQGAKYGKVEIITPLESKQAPAQVIVPYIQTFPFIPPLSPVSAALPFNSPLQQVVISTTVSSSPTYSTDLQTSIPSPTVQSHPPILFQQPVLPPPSIPKLLVSTHDFISFSTSSPTYTSNTSSPTTTKTPTVTPLKLTHSVPAVKVSKNNDNSHSPTIYSVLYADTGNKITLKRQTQDFDEDSSHMKEQKSNIITIKRENNNSTVTFKKPNQVSTPVQSPQQPTSGSVSESNNSSPNKLKRRGCRCGNATATPGKLTCCGQRCPCYVDSKACIDCKCRGCRNPHYVDGLKKMRHHVPDHQQQQEQQQSFLASLTNQIPASKSEDLVRVLEKSSSNSSTIITKNSIYSVNGTNGQYQQLRQIPQKTMLKESVKTMSPIVFPPTTVLQQQPSTSIGFPKTSSPGIQIVYSPMGQKIFMKSESMQTSAISLHTTTSTITAPTSKMTLNPHMYGNSLILNSNQIHPAKSIPQQTYYLDDTKKYFMIKQENYDDASEIDENLVDRKDDI